MLILPSVALARCLGFAPNLSDSFGTAADPEDVRKLFAQANPTASSASVETWPPFLFQLYPFRFQLSWDGRDMLHKWYRDGMDPLPCSRSTLFLPSKWSLLRHSHPHKACHGRIESQVRNTIKRPLLQDSKAMKTEDVY